MNNVDLSSLRIDASAPLQKRPLRQRLTMLALTAFALALVATFVLPLCWQPRPVPMVEVQLAEATAATSTIATVEAAGWVEPDPFHVLVRPLVPGCVESIDVLEGSVVKANETVLAKLKSAALLAAHERAVAVAREREQDLAVANTQARLAAAQLVQLGALRQAHHDAERLLAERTGKLVATRGAHRRALAEVQAATATRQAQLLLQELGGSYAVALSRAQAAVAAAEATANGAEHEVATLEREVAAATDARELAAERLANPVDLKGAVELAHATIEKATAALATAKAELAIAAREIAWATVKAPMDGVVLRLHATPGAMVGPQGDSLLALYDPQHLRARIDVPLAAAGGIREGQAVELRCELLGNTVVHGTVQRLQRESDLLKNTLQVKVALREPPALLRPETLCRARFLADANSTATGATGPRLFLVPKAAVRDGAVFRFDPAARRARALPVTIVGEQGDHVLVQGDLAPTQRVITTAVHDGESVREERR